MKKFCVSVLAFVICIFSVNFCSADEQNISLLEFDIGAWKFVKELGYENYFIQHEITNDKLLNNFQIYSFYIPCEKIGLGHIKNSDTTNEKLGVISLWVSKKSGRIGRVEFVFDSNSNQFQAVGEAMSVLIGKYNFLKDGKIFEQALKNIDTSYDSYTEFFSNSVGCFFRISKADLFRDDERYFYTIDIIPFSR